MLEQMLKEKLEQILKGRDHSKTTNKNTVAKFPNEKLINHYSTTLKNQHNVNRNKQNIINKNVKTNSNVQTNKENVKKNPPSTQKVSQSNSKTTNNNKRRSQIRRNIIFKNSSKR